MFEFLNEELESLKSSDLYRSLKTIENTDGTHIQIDGKQYLLFCSNNYLGLANHPKVIGKVIVTLKDFGVGSGASALISGYSSVHKELERRIAKFKNHENAIVFPTGYMANLGIITSLATENDTVIIDRLSHASIIDACKLSKAKLQVYKHCDMASLKNILKRSDKFKKRIIITDSVFSMDGDIAPLPDIVKLAKKYGAITIIDEAHATGVLGGSGRGLEEHFGIEGRIDIVMGTLSKAIGLLGGFIAGSNELIDYLRNKARSYIYTTALPPAICAASIAAFDVIENEPSLLTKLFTNIKTISPSSQTPIIPIIIGDTKRTMEVSQKLFDRGIFVSGIRPPTVPEGESRLRITVTANHTKEEIDFLLSSIKDLTQILTET